MPAGSGWRRPGSSGVLADGPVDESAIGPALRLRWLLLGAGLLAIVLAVVPPLVVAAGRYDVYEALEFCLLAFVAPVLLVLAAPWSLRRERLARLGGTLAERSAFGRLRNRGQARAVAFVVPSMLAIVGWRIPVAVDGLARHRLLVVAELATLVPAGMLAWLEVLASPPLLPRSPRPRRVVLAALPMWTVWICAFALGFSRSAWFRAYHHAAGSGLSLIADQQLTAIVLWFVPFCIFIPYELANIIRWLRGGEDPDIELRALVRSERRFRGG